MYVGFSLVCDIVLLAAINVQFTFYADSIPVDKFFSFIRPTYLLSTPLDIRPGSNFIIGIDILDDCPPLVKVEAEIQKDNITVLEGEGIFQRGK